MTNTKEKIPNCFIFIVTFFLDVNEPTRLQWRGLLSIILILNMVILWILLRKKITRFGASLLTGWGIVLILVAVFQSNVMFDRNGNNPFLPEIIRSHTMHFREDIMAYSGLENWIHVIGSLIFGFINVGSGLTVIEKTNKSEK